MFAEFAGLTQEVATIIEGHRKEASETKSDILLRILPRHASMVSDDVPPFLDIGQGVHLPEGERLFLYLSKPGSVDQNPDGIAEVRSGALYLDGTRVRPSHGSVLAPAMQNVQRRLRHTDESGKPVSLSGFRQWHVIRNGRLTPLEDLKDPKLRRTRTRKLHNVDLSKLNFDL